MKILASDFDNTIYYLDNPEQNQKNVEAIQRFVSYGNIFIIITGRNYTDLKKLLVENRIPYSYLVCEDGAKIFNNVDYCIDTTYLEKSEIERIEEILKEENCDYFLDDGYNKTEFLDDCVKIVVNCNDEEEKERIVKTVREKIDVHIYASRFHVNIIHKTVNKKTALKTLMNLEQLDYNRLHVIGDNDNDYEMLKEFHGGVITKHHQILDELKKEEYDSISDYIEELMKH